MATTKTTKVKPSKKKDQQDKENVASALDTADLNSAVDIHKLRQKHEELRLKNEMVRRKKRADIQKDSPLAMSRGGPAISGSEMKKLNDQIGVLEKKLSKSDDKVENRGKQIEKLDEEKKALQTELGGVKTELASTKTEHKKTLKELETLKKKVTALEQKIRDMQGKSANPKAEVCEDIAAFTKEEVKYYMFQYKKFARVLPDKSSPDLETWGGKIYDRCKAQYENPEEFESQVSKEDYIRVYSHIILQELSDCRQYVQTQLMSAAEVFYEKYDRAPTAEDMIQIRELTTKVDEKHKEETEHKFTNDELEALWMLTWYHDVWLNKGSVYAKYGNTVRFYEPCNAKNEEGRYHVTTQTEAFAELVRNNCEDKWNAVFKLRKNDDKRNKTPIPKFNKNKPDTHVYHTTKWTDPKSGPKKGGGWKGNWATIWRATVINFKEFRAEQKKVDNLFYALGLKLVRQTNNVAHASYEASRKRKRPTVDEPVFVDEPVDDCGDDFAESDCED